MNKPQIKNFSVWARIKLIETVSYRMSLIGITEKGIAEALPQSTADLKFYDIGTEKPAEVKGNDITYRTKLVNKIDADGYKNTVEEIAYTWFNRLIAIRFMEVNDYLPSRVRVLSSLESGKSEPDIVTEAVSVAENEFFDITADEIYRLKDENKADELFGKMFEFQCRQLHDCLPELFEKSADYMEMLLPVSYTDKDGIIYHLVHDIPEDDFNISKTDENTGKPVGQVEIIGWLYQYYNTEPKDAVFANLKKNIKISKENIAAATQLFTPDWIVRYMVENSLGRLWTDGHPDTSVRSEWKYYLEEAEQTPEVQAQLAEIREGRKQLAPEQIRFIDPCMGSGHILVYAFDVLMQIYLSCGYTERDAAQNIVRHNLWGLDLDKRAYQLAYFAVMMKARQYDRRFLTRGIKPNLAHFQGLDSVCDANVSGALKEFADQFKNCDIYGSLTEMTEIKGLDEALDDFSGVIGMEFDKTERMMTIYKILSQKYDIVCTNPPYMGGNYAPKLNTFLKKHYPETKNDMFAVFIEYCMAITTSYVSMVTPESWMFLFSYFYLRNKISNQFSITNMIHLGLRAFECGFGTSAFILKKNTYSSANKYCGKFIRLINYLSSEEKRIEFFNDNNRYECSNEIFMLLPNRIMAYWCNYDFAKLLDNTKPLCDYIELYPGIKTGNNDLFLRLWYEVNAFKTACNPSLNTLASDKFKWYYYNKGGGYRKWYGGYEYVVDFQCNAKNIKNKINKDTYRLRNPNNYFVNGILWPLIGSDRFSCRYLPSTVLSDVASNAIFCHNSFYYSVMAFMNSNAFNYILNMINPTVSYPIDSVGKVPYVKVNKNELQQIVRSNIDLCKTDWDSFETSWDFKRHPMI